MRCPRILPVVALLLGGSANLAATAEVATVEGTWVLTQGVSIGETGSLPGDLHPVVELLHLDADSEVREVSSLFREGGCGRELRLAMGLTMRIPFTASLGIGHWAVESDASLRIVSYHLLYDCTGAAIGVAWAVREAALCYEEEASLEEGTGAGGNVSNASRGRPLEWNGRTTIEFFTVTGQPLPLPLLVSPFPGEGFGTSRITGPFRARRLSGEPRR
ncbi:MAG: hypothetical protein KJ062_17485 [Thermoanaerobaculia bacterium]|nr:hypothetical protein [Thermoanaerobaculia bacterium]